MLFNSIDFALFLPVVFAVYWLIPGRRFKLQNFVIFLASYIFYGWWNWKFLGLIALSTVIDFSVALLIASQEKKTCRIFFLWISIATNLGLLGFFKYYNFFSESFVAGFSILGFDLKLESLKIVLPVGISFYTFQTLSYTIDVYRRKLEPTRDFIAFSAFVSFFPQLVAGPIERATHLLPQFYKPRAFNYGNSVDGLRQILWGLFKKLVIADNCAVLANYAFNRTSDLNGSTLALGVFFFAFQIYGDFSGYSDIAIGTSKLFQFDLMQNFAYPYFSRNIANFWRRWHISLSTWFRDYVYIPLGGSRGNAWQRIRNTVVIFVVSGLWHGANWTFVIWGALNALYFLPFVLAQSKRKYNNRAVEENHFPDWREMGGIAVTFCLTLIAWVFFRAKSVGAALLYLRGIFSTSIFAFPEFKNDRFLAILLVLIIFFIAVEWQGRNQKFALEKFALGIPKYLRYALYYMLVSIILLFGGNSGQEFIYFQF
ncbi:MAG: MBOAT family O-acyltransferase [Lentisphaeria bacterium]|nr:MBOAT family O-acyltransferase [Lentisphaeria bacterium]